MKLRAQPFRIYVWNLVNATQASQVITVPGPCVLKRVIVSGYNDAAATSGLVQLNFNSVGPEIANVADFNANTAFLTSYVGNAYGQGARSFDLDMYLNSGAKFYIWWYALAATITAAGVHCIFFPVTP